MAINFVIPVQLLFEAVMIIIESIAYAYALPLGTYAQIDRIYLVTVCICFVLSLAWLVYFRKPDVYYAGWARASRSAEGVGLLILGGMTIYSAVIIQSDSLCHYVEQTYYQHCQRYSMKMAAGVLAMLNGIFYFARPCKIQVTPVTIMTQQHVMVAHHIPQGYTEPPPSYFNPAGQPGSYVVQYLPNGGPTQIVTHQIPQGYYAPNSNGTYPAQAGFTYPMPLAPNQTEHENRM